MGRKAFVFDVARCSGCYCCQLACKDEHCGNDFTPIADEHSQPVYDKASISAVGVACHEAGHAIQHAQDYAPLRIRNAIIPVTNFGSKLAVPLVILGIILAQFGQQFLMIAVVGVLAFCLCVVFQLVTLPTEFDASRRALACIEEYGLLTDDERAGAKKVLTAAAMTYVASLAVALSQLLRLMLIVASNSRRN